MSLFVVLFLLIANFCKAQNNGAPVPNTGTTIDLECGESPLFALRFLSKGINVWDKTLVEGSMEIVKDSCSGESQSCATFKIRSGPLWADGHVHSATLQTFVTIFKEDLRRGDLVAVEMRAAPVAALVDPQLRFSVGAQIDGEDQTLEMEPVVVIRDGQWHTYQFHWRAPRYRPMYKRCHVMGAAGVCMVKSECEALGKVAHDMAGIDDMTFTVSGCEEVTQRSDVKCCGDYLGGAYELPPSVTDAEPNSRMALRFYSADESGVEQSIDVRSVSICVDECGGACDWSKGEVCDITEKSCFCQNKYPWVRAPDGACYNVEAGEYPCQQCPTDSMFTHYDTENQPLAGVERTVCELDLAGERVCGCAAGFKLGKAGQPLTPGLLHCVANDTPEPEKVCEPECGGDHKCRDGVCVCDAARNLIPDPSDATRCIFDCSNCVKKERCVQPPFSGIDGCICGGEYEPRQNEATGLLTCLVECVCFGADLVCVGETGECVCKPGFERDSPDAACKAKLNNGAVGDDQKRDDEREAEANGGCTESCGARQRCNGATKQCECQSHFQTLDDGACFEDCDNCEKALPGSKCVQLAGEGRECQCYAGMVLTEDQSRCAPPANAGTENEGANKVRPDAVQRIADLVDVNKEEAQLLLLIIGASVLVYLCIVASLICVVVYVRVQRRKKAAREFDDNHGAIGMHGYPNAGMKTFGGSSAASINLDTSPFSPTGTVSNVGSTQYQYYDHTTMAGGNIDGNAEKAAY